VATLSGVVAQVTETREPKGPRWARRGLLTLAAAVTFLGVVLVVAAWTEDISIDGDIGYVNAEVVSVNFTRTLVRFYTPDGAEHIPQTGVLYPAGLKEGDVVQVEYSQDNPELVRVAGRGAIVSLLPVGLTVVGVWAVIVPTAWWLRRRM
jgi:subtilisin family serine protease